VVACVDDLVMPSRLRVLSSQTRPGQLKFDGASSYEKYCTNLEGVEVTPCSRVLMDSALVYCSNIFKRDFSYFGFYDSRHV